jgi:hypothetical protein
VPRPPDPGLAPPYYPDIDPNPAAATPGFPNARFPIAPPAPPHPAMIGRSGKAIAAMVLGIVGVVMCFTVIPSILALVFGLIAGSQIKRSEGRLTGKGMATTGIVLGIVGLLLGIGFYALAATGSFDEVTTGSLASDLHGGDCVKVPEQGVVFRLHTQDCAVAHEGEVYLVGELNNVGSGPYPGTADVQETVGRLCASAFESYIGVAYNDSDLDFTFVYPAKSNWNRGDGGYVCIVVDPTGGALTGSVAGSKR